jgi:hypothetical protein
MCIVAGHYCHNEESKPECFTDCVMTAMGTDICCATSTQHRYKNRSAVHGVRTKIRYFVLPVCTLPMSTQVGSIDVKETVIVVVGV